MRFGRRRRVEYDEDYDPDDVYDYDTDVPHSRSPYVSWVLKEVDITIIDCVDSLGPLWGTALKLSVAAVAIYCFNQIVSVMEWALRAYALYLVCILFAEIMRQKCDDAKFQETLDPIGKKRDQYEQKKWKQYKKSMKQFR